MLQLSNISKSYSVADFTQTALDNVSISFRDNEFVAILGPSGSGKTTLLNIVGGLDRYDSGSLSIDGINTADYKDRDWDTYRNNRIGFVFQSYNLIPHQTVLSNVELALTLSGVSRDERKKRAVEALSEVGLGEHVNKKPNQLSGGQMQRVAIARALINDPEILLADEPTGALDSETSVQIMSLLTEIAKDRLVIMVTHNPELAEEYATRIVNLKDGVLKHDSDPFFPSADDKQGKQPRKTSMSFFTAIALSFNNLMTKKGRTIMTAFAGSIGIIGIAAILSLANGVNNYIKTVEEDTLSVYPLSIMSQGMDMSTIFSVSEDAGMAMDNKTELSDEEKKAKEGKVREVSMISKTLTSIGANDLPSLKKFLDGNGGGINDYANLIQYSYNIDPQIYVISDKDKVHQVNPDKNMSAFMGGSGGMGNMMPSAMSGVIFNELIDDRSLIEEQYELKAGKWPSSRDEVVLVLTPGGALSDYGFYAMGLRNPAEFESMIKKVLNDEVVEEPVRESTEFTYEEIFDVRFKLVKPTDFYSYDAEFETWVDKSKDSKFLDEIVRAGEDLKISGILQAREGITATALNPGFYYDKSLTQYISDEAAKTDIVKEQLANPTINVLSGISFADEEEGAGAEKFDMSKMISIDEKAIGNAFKFDQSQLKIDASSLDFSSFDMPSMTLDPSTLPQLDMSALMGSMNFAPEMNLESVISDVDLEKAGVERERVNEFAQKYGSAFMQYVLTTPNAGDDLSAAFEAFSQTPEAQAILAEFMGDFETAQAGIMEQISKSIETQMAAQIAASAEKMQAQLQAAMAQYMQTAMAEISKQIQSQMGAALEKQIGKAMKDSFGSIAKNMSSAMSIDEQAFMDAFKMNLDQDELVALIMSMMTTERSSYESNLSKLGYADEARPHSINIYPKDFESKGEIVKILDQYNEDMKSSGQEDKVVTYTDLVGTLMSSVTDIINVISYVLAAFVAISLVVSSIMIGVITYVSVLERKKEIGILRSIGASKRDIRRVFNAETIIVGFVAGALGIGATLLLSIPANIIVEKEFAIKNVMLLPAQAGAILVLVSMGLTYVAGLFPASAASRKDPVEALRAE